MAKSGDRGSAPLPVPTNSGPLRGQDRPELADFIEIFGEASVPVTLISLGLAFAGASVGAGVDQVSGWSMPEYIGAVSFGALLVVLGCLERIVQLRSARAPVVPRTPGTETESR
jgi:hypothetical protein